MRYTKRSLFEEGVDLIRRFCKLNKLNMPEILLENKEDWIFEACAYYRPTYIKICVDKCAAPCGDARSQHWSWPGNTVDRTPYGVLAHELGHHCDYITGEQKYRYSSDYSITLRNASGEKAISGYCPNDAEWFAEMFRLFITNPLLLQKIRPKTFALITREFKPLKYESWESALLDEVPTRVIEACRNKIDAANRS